VDRKGFRKAHQALSGYLNKVGLLYKDQTFFRTYKHCLRKSAKFPASEPLKLLEFAKSCEFVEHRNSPWHRMFLLIEDEVGSGRLKPKVSPQKVFGQPMASEGLRDPKPKLRIYVAPHLSGHRPPLREEPSVSSHYNEAAAKDKAVVELVKLSDRFKDCPKDESQIRTIGSYRPTHVYDWDAVDRSWPTFKEGRKSFYRGPDGVREIPKITFEEGEIRKKARMDKLLKELGPEGSPSV